MFSRRFLPTVCVSVVLCCFALAGYYWFRKVTLDGGYTEWSAWSNCSKECGEGIQTRYRLCAWPPPGKYGKDCYRFGPDKDKKPCFLKICPIDGGYGDWSAFSACNKPCGGGKQARTRLCNSPPAIFGGKPCEGPSREEQECNTHVCPIDGGYTQWSEYGPCSVTCGKGIKTRTRSCTNPPPSNGGKPCSEPASEYTQCDSGECPVLRQQEETQRNDSPQKDIDQHVVEGQKPEQMHQNAGNQVAQGPDQHAAEERPQGQNQ